MAFPPIKMIIQALQSMGPRAGLRAARYSVTASLLDRRYGQRPPRGPFQTPGAVTAVERHPHHVLVHAERGYIEIAALSGEILRVRARTDAAFPAPFSYAVSSNEPAAPAILTHDNPSALTVQTDRLVCRVQKDSCRLVFETPDGRTISEDAGGLAWRGNEVRWTRHLAGEEACYGLGQRASALNLRGQRLSLWNADPLPGYARDADPVYFSIPFYLGVQPGLAFGILWDNPARGYADLGAQHPRTMTFAAEAGELRFYIFAGPTVADVLRQYTDLTGRMPLPPLWALGFHQARWGYDSGHVYRALAAEFRQRRLPCDVLYFDIDYMDGHRVFTWDPQRFGRLPDLLAELAGQGFKAVAILDPGIKVDRGYAAYEDGVRADVFLKYRNGRRVTAPVWPGNCHFPDFTSPRVRLWWAGHARNLLRAGFAGLWNDMNEPTVFSLERAGTLPDHVLHDWEGMGNTHAGGGHNVYGMLMARASREALEQEHPDRRPFVMTRAGHAGAQRYTSTWTGDNIATWEHLRLSLTMVLNAGLAGMPFTGPDVGGFAGNPDGELFARWMQLGSLLPYFRVHSAAGTAPQEPWRYGEQVEAIARQSLELRYQLLPYLYSAFARCAQDGLPIVRPLFMADPDDPKLRAVNDAFLVGDALLAAPVLEQGAVRREVVLPAGTWYALDTGQRVEGGQTVTVDAPLERLPVYVRAGTVLPLWPVMQYVGERALDEVRLRAYVGNGETAWYEDAGEGLAYRDGEYRWSWFTCTLLPSGQFALAWRHEGRYAPPYQRVRVEVVGLPAEPERVLLDGQAAPIWYYEGGSLEFVAPPFSEARVVGRGGAA